MMDRYFVEFVRVEPSGERTVLSRYSFPEQAFASAVLNDLTVDGIISALKRRLQSGER